MRVNRQRRNNLTYRQTVYVILTFYIVHRGICNSTDTNNSTSTSNSTVSDTNVYSTPNPPSVSSTTLDTSTDSQISIASNTISSTTNTLTAYSITTLNTSTSSSTLTAVSSTHTRSSILSNNASYTTSLDNTTTDITSSESSINVSTVYNTTYIPVTSLAINCTATINGTNNSSSKTCQQDIETIPVKSTSLTAEEGTNITIHGNDTWDCPDVVWYRHYNWSTHGHHIYSLIALRLTTNSSAVGHASYQRQQRVENGTLSKNITNLAFTYGSWGVAMLLFAAVMVLVDLGLPQSAWRRWQSHVDDEERGLLI
ncbi:membrane protein RL12/membrane protein UL6 fusion protein [Human betaherpesvirus 5]|uniref:Membrane protein RL12/membrane protein UL6 fusion protein n=1 Tax=Human cytomegalovirus TaxID=10359 RepID=J7EHF5_HCMV|nr:membrane protein RL12/membrane protein UL6 fusion protein [Human betaherpesvirus 5]